MKPSSENPKYSCLHCQRQFCANQISNAHTCLVNEKKAIFESVDDNQGVEVCQVCDSSLGNNTFFTAIKVFSHQLGKLLSPVYHPSTSHSKHSMSRMT